MLGSRVEPCHLTGTDGSAWDSTQIYLGIKMVMEVVKAYLSSENILTNLRHTAKQRETLIQGQKAVFRRSMPILQKLN